MREELLKLPKIELHLHLDGSMSLSVAKKISNLPDDVLRKKMIAPDKCNNLSEYLTKFDFTTSLMQTKKNLSLIATDLSDYLKRQNVIYAEVRFAPMFHTKNGLSYDEIITSILEGFDKNSHPKVNLILCLMRGADDNDNWKTVEVAKKYLHKGVCAIDLAGAEDKYPLTPYLKFFEKAREEGIPFTIHAGENGEASEVEKAIMVGAKRIGHGIHAINDTSVMRALRDKNVLLEVCPTSNVQTNAIDTYANHPIKKLYDEGISVSINTDNRIVSNIELVDEYLKLSKYFAFTLDDYKKMNIEACKHAFISDKEKKELLRELNSQEKI